MVSEEKVKEYEFNLANLIRDVRDDLDAPMMPVIIGGMGQNGVNATGR
jgi:Carbohydrate esterase, sialic acid-specific acetylesterase